MMPYEDWKKDIFDETLSIDDLLERWSGKVPSKVDTKTNESVEKSGRILKLLEEARKKAGL